MEKDLNPNSNLSAKGTRDWKLIQLALKKGDQKAYADLMGRYKDTIFFMLLKMVKDKDDADDLTIEAFGKAFRNLGQYTPDFAFSTWLFKIATNNCIDFIICIFCFLIAFSSGFSVSDFGSNDISSPSAFS